MPLIPTPPEPLKSLMKLKKFVGDIRKYNSCFQMTSFRASQIRPSSGFKGNFTVQGQVYHSMGPVLNTPGNDAKFLQIYFMDNSEQEAQRRCEILPEWSPDKEIISKIQAMLHNENVLVKSFKNALDGDIQTENAQVVIRADKCPKGEHERRYNAPSSNDVAVLLSNQQAGKRDIVVKLKSSDPKHIMRIKDGHRKYDAFQYPIIFWNGQDSYDLAEKIEIGIRNKNKLPHLKEECNTANDIYKYLIQVRTDEFNHLIKCNELFQQFIVDMFAKIDSERLFFHSSNQKVLRADSYKKVVYALDGNLPNIGKQVILASSYTGGPRYYHKKQMDAMAYVRKHGRASLFVTLTCNPKWTEIQDQLEPGQTETDRPDIVARVFKLKVGILKDLIRKNFFGKTVAYLHSIEWQKRGLPHVHILIWLEEDLKPSDIDRVICAEIPDKDEDPELFKIITTCNIHGPCGPCLNMNAPCMQNGKCSKKFPKEFKEHTRSDGEGYPEYRRRKPGNGGREYKITKGGKEIEIDNRIVVPYNPLLSKTFNAHINVEICNSVKAIKYVIKYVTKGSDMAVFGVQKQNSNNSNNDSKKNKQNKPLRIASKPVVQPKNLNDEVEVYKLGRYISSSEAIWRIYDFNIHEHYPAVEPLSVHLPGMQVVFFDPEVPPDNLDKPTTLTGFFTLCQENDFAKDLLYIEVPWHFRWHKNKWISRAKKDQSLGRVFTVPPSQEELHCLRLLLFVVRGPKSFECLRTVEGFLCPTFKEAARKQGLLEDDNQYNDALTEASLTDTSSKLRELLDKNPKATYGMTPFHLAAEACCDCLKIKIQKPLME